MNTELGRQQAEAFCEKYWNKLMRPEGVLAVAAEVNSGAEVTICSASPALVLQPWADKLGIKLIGTQLEVKDGKLTGRITGNNCRCAQKVARLEKVYGDLNAYHLRAWGDTRGDHELLAAAQDPHWRHFHHPRKRRNSPIKGCRVAAWCYPAYIRTPIGKEKGAASGLTFPREHHARNNPQRQHA